MAKNYKQIPISRSTERSLIPILDKARCDGVSLYSEKETAIEAFELPFFKNYLYLEAWTLNSTPPVSFSYLWNKKKDVITIDGTKECIFDNLPKLGLVLNRETIVPYIRFVLDCVWTEDGSLRLTEHYEEIKFSGNPTEDEKDFLLKNIRPAKIEQTGNGYNVDAVVILGDTLYQAKIALQNNGIFDIESETLLCEDYSCLRPVFLE